MMLKKLEGIRTIEQLLNSSTSEESNNQLKQQQETTQEQSSAFRRRSNPWSIESLHAEALSSTNKPQQAYYSSAASSAEVYPSHYYLSHPQSSFYPYPSTTNNTSPAGSPLYSPSTVVIPTAVRYQAYPSMHVPPYYFPTNSSPFEQQVQQQAYPMPQQVMQPMHASDSEEDASPTTGSVTSNKDNLSQALGTVSKISKRKRRNNYKPSQQEIENTFHLPLHLAAAELNICTTKLKLLCREYNITKWPYRNYKKLNLNEPETEVPQSSSPQEMKPVSKSETSSNYYNYHPYMQQQQPMGYSTLQAH